MISFWITLALGFGLGVCAASIVACVAIDLGRKS